MQRLLQTSTGWVLFELNRYPGTEYVVSATPFHADGWEGEGKTWMQEHGDAEQGVPLDEFLGVRLGIPAAEAQTLADTILGPWREEWERRGGSDYARKLTRISFGVMGALAVGAAFALIGIVLVIWLFAT